MPLTRYCSVVIHDVAPKNWSACQRVLRAIREVADVPVTLLVVPRYHLRPSNTGFERALTKLVHKGHELALHGYSHLDEGTPNGWLDYLKRRLYTAGEGEFAALHEEEALRRLHTGIRWFEHRHWPLRGFIAPAWLLSTGSWNALRTLPFEYTATLNHVYRLPDGCPLPSDCMAFSTRSPWRRLLSLSRNAWVQRRWQAQPLVRLELHPHDADFPMIKRMWTQALSDLIGQREVVTLSEGVQRAMQAQASWSIPEDESALDGPPTIPCLHSMWVPADPPEAGVALTGTHS